MLDLSSQLEIILSFWYRKRTSIRESDPRGYECACVVLLHLVYSQFVCSHSVCFPVGLLLFCAHLQTSQFVTLCLMTCSVYDFLSSLCRWSHAQACQTDTRALTTLTRSGSDNARKLLLLKLCNLTPVVVDTLLHTPVLNLCFSCSECYCFFFFFFFLPAFLLDCKHVIVAFRNSIIVIVMQNRLHFRFFYFDNNKKAKKQTIIGCVGVFVCFFAFSLRIPVHIPIVIIVGFFLFLFATSSTISVRGRGSVQFSIDQVGINELWVDQLDPNCECVWRVSTCIVKVS